ncbi:MAG: hypothetical protein AAF282_19135 [Cyanobacteria bacterium P01_A01_bin.15]
MRLFASTRLIQLWIRFAHYLARVQQAIGQNSQRDYRFVLVLALAVYGLCLYASSFFTEYHIFWQQWFRVNALQPAFADLRVLTSGFECARLGYDVTLNNPCDPWGRPSPYPRLWWSLARLGIDQSHTIIIGVILALSLYGCIWWLVGRLNIAQAIVYSLFLCSPTAMLLVERGNNDIIIFLLFCAALWCMKSLRFVIRLGGYGLVYFGMMLKLFPVFGLVVILREQGKRFWWLTVVTVAAVLGYVGLFGQEIEVISSISRAAQLSPNNTYGPKILLLQLTQPQHMTRELLNIVSFILISPWLFKLIIQSHRALRPYPNLAQGQHVSAFRLGAAIFIATSVVSVSWDYRLFFIVLTLPQLFDLVVLEKTSQLPVAAIATTVATMYLSSISLFDECANLMLLVVNIYYFYEFLPTSLKQLLNIGPFQQSAN